MTVSVEKLGQKKNFNRDKGCSVVVAGAAHALLMYVYILCVVVVVGVGGSLDMGS